MQVVIAGGGNIGFTAVKFGQPGCARSSIANVISRMELEIPAMLIDLVRVKGKQKPIRIYTPLAGPELSREEADKYSQHQELGRQAFELYQGRQWQEAITIYQKLPYPKFAEVLSQRCRSFAANPPPDNWDGAFNLVRK